MIDAKELRIGNLVNFSYKYKKQNVYRSCKVLAIKLDGVALDDIHGVLAVGFDDSVSPILLTPEILVDACGFEKDKSNEFWNFYSLKNGWYIGEALHNEPSAAVKTGYYYWGDDYHEMQYLHQLQNLYYALTGIELSIDIKKIK